MGVPKDMNLDLPLLVYGAFRPKELAHARLVDCLTSDPRPARVQGYELRLRDGLPLLVERPGATLEGDVLHLSAQGYAVVGDYEPKALYRWVVIPALVDGQEVPVNALSGYKPDDGVEPEPVAQWRGHDDPLFGPGLAAIGDQALPLVRRPHPGAPGDASFWPRFIRLQGLYLTTWTVAERVSTLVFGPGIDPGERVARLDGWVPAQDAVERASPPDVRAFDSRNPKKVASSATKDAFFNVWYAARSNLSHRGKAAMTDADLVRRSLIGLHDTMRLLLLQQLPGLFAVWQKADNQSPKPGLREPWLLRMLWRSREFCQSRATTPWSSTTLITRAFQLRRPVRSRNGYTLLSSWPSRLRRASIATRICPRWWCVLTRPLGASLGSGATA